MGLCSRATLRSLLAAAIAAGAAAGSAGGDLEIARQALRDGLWQVARTHAEAAGGETARLVVLESYASENRWDDVKAELAKLGEAAKGPAFDYYRAASEGRFAEAAELLRKGGSVAGLAEAKMLEADMQAKSANIPAAKSLWSEVVAMTNAGERALAVASVNLGDVAEMRKAYERTVSAPLKRMVGLRLGAALLDERKTESDGERLIREIVRDSPDADGAKEAFAALAAAQLSAGRWQDAEKTYADAIEIWPGAAKSAEVQEGRGEAFLKLGRREEALEAFTRAEQLASDDAARALAVLKQGDALAELGRGEESMQRYRTVLEKYPSTETADSLRRIVRLRELETQGRDLYKEYRFGEARKAFAEVAAADPDRRARMAFCDVLCLYGLGLDEEALKKARALAASCPDATVRAEAVLWLAKFTYNSGEWKESLSLFQTYAGMRPESATAPDALLWAARAAFAANDFALAIQTSTRLLEAYPDSPAVPPALIVQAEALIEQARFDEAVLVLERVAISDSASRHDRLRAKVLKADALFAMGADNPARYEAALEAYRAVRFDDGVEPGERLSVAFKTGRVLEKLRRNDEAIDQYYSQVVLAYRDGLSRGERLGDEARAAFSRAAFRLADEFEGRGKDYQAIGVLRLVVESGVPASEEAEKRIARISMKGKFL